MSLPTTTEIPIHLGDPVNARILAVSEDRIQGFLPDPLAEIARRAGLDRAIVVERIVGMLRLGVIRRVRQTLLATSLAQGSLVAWEVSEDRLHSAFDHLFQHDPFSGHVVIRSTDSATAGSRYRLWTTLKVPRGYSIRKHCDYLLEQVGATSYRLMPAKRLFVLGVGHIRRRDMEPGSKSDALADVTSTELAALTDQQWRVLTALKREFTADEIAAAAGSGLGREHCFWSGRAAEAWVDLSTFLEVARSLHNRGLIGRFSTFLEHVKPLATGERVTRFNALFHWAVPPGREIEAGRQVGRFHIMTHAYWREGGPDFNHVNIMGVAHGGDKDLLLAHKRAIDGHLEGVGIAVTYTNVFWGGRSEIKPSEICPAAYRDWCIAGGIDPEAMRQ